MKKLTLLFSLGCFLISCGLSQKGALTSTTSSPPGPRGTMSTSIGTTPPSKKIVVDVKDKTPHPNLQALAPGDPDITGWKKTVVTLFANIPNALPNPNQIFYTAKKTINGVDRSISVVFGDILKESDAIVNAANSGLEGGGGIDGVIHTAAIVKSEDLMKVEAIAYKKLHKIASFPVGSAMVTHSYGLDPQITMVVFTVGPQGASDATKNEQLFSAIYNSLKKASEYNAKSISIPAVSTGIFGFPLDVASFLFFKAALQFFSDNPTTSIENIRFTNNDNKTTTEIAKGFIATFK